MPFVSSSYPLSPLEELELQGTLADFGAVNRAIDAAAGCWSTAASPAESGSTPPGFPSQHPQHHHHDSPHNPFFQLHQHHIPSSQTQHHQHHQPHSQFKQHHHRRCQPQKHYALSSVSSTSDSPAASSPSPSSSSSASPYSFFSAYAPTGNAAPRAMATAKSDVWPAPKQLRFVHNQGQPPSKRRRISAA